MQLLKEIIIKEDAKGNVRSVRGVYGDDTLTLRPGIDIYNPNIRYQGEERQWHLTLNNIDSVETAKEFLRSL